MAEAERCEDRQRQARSDETEAGPQGDLADDPPSVGVQQDRPERLALEDRVALSADCGELTFELLGSDAVRGPNVPAKTGRTELLLAPGA